MGRRPCCLKEGVNRGAWSAQEDQILSEYIKSHGEGKWREMPKRAGLRRCGKSCRLRWLNYLRPDIKRGNIAPEEEDLIIRLHKLLGNRWSLIAGRLPGRTDNEIKNYWNTCLSKRMKAKSSSRTTTDQEHTTIKSKESRPSTNTAEPGEERLTTGIEPHQVIRTKAGRCTKLLFSPPKEAEPITQNDTELEHNEIPPFLAQHKDDCLSFLMDFDMGEIDILDSNYMMQVAVGDHEIHEKISNPMGGDNGHLSEAVLDDCKESFSVAYGACLELEMLGLF